MPRFLPPPLGAGAPIAAGDVVCIVEDTANAPTTANATAVSAVVGGGAGAPKKVATKSGATFHVERLVGTKYGGTITGKRDTSNGRAAGSASVRAHVLPLNCDLLPRVMQHRTQILYDADVALIAARLELRPGMVVVESGTGSANLTHAITRAVAPTGRVHSFEFHLGRTEGAREDMRRHRLLRGSENGALASADAGAAIYHRDVCTIGFPASEPTMDDAGASLPDAAASDDTASVPYADAGMLDLPNPWLAAKSLARVVRPNGHICSFSPCTEQVLKASQALVAAGFTDLKVVECLTRPYDVEKNMLMEHAAVGSLVKVARSKDQPPAKRTRMTPPAKRARMAAALEAEMSEDSDDDAIAHAAAAEKKRELEEAPPTASAIGARVHLDGKGHTGYLLFARRRL